MAYLRTCDVINELPTFICRSFRAADPTRRPSVHILRPVGLLNQFKPNFTPASTCATSSTSGTTGATAGHLAMIQGPPDSHSDPHPEYAPPFSPRRSMPEIKPMTFSHFKRNSYQEDRRPAVIILTLFLICVFHRYGIIKQVIFPVIYVHF